MGTQVKRVYLHIGLQKTGTSFLQDAFFHSSEPLAHQGLDLVPDNRLAAFQLMLRIRGRYEPAFDPPEVSRALDRFRTQLRAARGDRALVTEESLAAATRVQIGGLLEACEPREVHVVLTVRDLARQIPSAWQEWVKRSMPLSFEDYLRVIATRPVDEVYGGQGGHRAAHRFWAQQDLTKTLRRWSLDVPPGRLHIVTVPQPAASPLLLLTRFCEVIEVDPRPLKVDPHPRNTSLGHVQTELLRRVNAALPDELRRRDVHGEVAKRYFAGQVLRRQDAAPPRLHTRHREWCTAVATSFTDEIRTHGYHVVGELAELLPEDDSFTDDPAIIDDTSLATAAVEALARLLTDEAERRLRMRSSPTRLVAKLRALVPRPLTR